jgi:hypothetical protein
MVTRKEGTPSGPGKRSNFKAALPSGDTVKTPAEVGLPSRITHNWSLFSVL